MGYGEAVVTWNGAVCVTVPSGSVTETCAWYWPGGAAVPSGSRPFHVYEYDPGSSAPENSVATVDPFGSRIVAVAWAAGAGELRERRRHGAPGNHRRRRGGDEAERPVDDKRCRRRAEAAGARSACAASVNVYRPSGSAPGENANVIARADCSCAPNNVSTTAPVESATVAETAERAESVYETVAVSAKPSPFGDTTGETVSPWTSVTGGGGGSDPPRRPRSPA